MVDHLSFFTRSCITTTTNDFVLQARDEYELGAGWGHDAKQIMGLVQCTRRGVLTMSIVAPRSVQAQRGRRSDVAQHAMSQSEG